MNVRNKAGREMGPFLPLRRLAELNSAQVIANNNLHGFGKPFHPEINLAGGITLNE